MGKQTENLDEILEKSQGTDVKLLLIAKEKIKQNLATDPSQANTAAFERVSKMLENAISATATIPDWRAMLAFAASKNRKLAKTKLYEDIKKGLLKKQVDGSFKITDANRYIASLPVLTVTDATNDRIMDRQRRKEEEEIRRIKAIADKEEFMLAVRKGEFLPRKNVYMELASRAVALAFGLKSTFEANILDYISLVSGNPKNSKALIAALWEDIEKALNEYSRELQFDIDFTDVELKSDESDGTDNTESADGTV